MNRITRIALAALLPAAPRGAGAAETDKTLVAWAAPADLLHIGNPPVNR